MVLTPHRHATFVAADPPRLSWLALWDESPASGDAQPVQSADPELRILEITGPPDDASSRNGDAGENRTRKVLARRVDIAALVDDLVNLPAHEPASPSVRAWSTAALFAIDLIGRGVIRPGVTDSGVDQWRLGSLGVDDEQALHQLADALPPQAYAVPVGVDADSGSSEVLVPRPTDAVMAFLGAIVDVMPRTCAASRVTGVTPFAGSASTELDDDTSTWLQTLSPTHSDAAVVLQVVAPEEGSDFELEVVLRSRSTPSYEITAVDFWNDPGSASVVLGANAIDDVLSTLRRAVALWPAVGRFLAQSRPVRIQLSSVEVQQLLGDASTDLASVGITVHWPEHSITPLKLIPVVTTTALPAGIDNEVNGAGRQANTNLSLQALADLRWEASMDGIDLTPEELEAVHNSPTSLVRIRDQWVRIDPAILERLSEERSLDVSEALAIALGGMAPTNGEFVEARVSGPIAELASRLASLDSREPAEAIGLDGELRDYQQRGLTWLAEMADLGLGGVLADDMGLGKTIQVLALHLARPNLGGPTLVICPATLIGNWEREAASFAPHIPVRRFHGLERSLEDLDPREIVVATYGLARREVEALSAVHWGLVIADEAQAVKNPESRTARAIRQLPASARFALTGTPVENHLLDVWSLLDWTTPGLLGNRTRFRREVALPIERSRDAVKAESFSRLIAPFVLRRRKSDPSVAPELPPKTETDHFVSLTDEQAALYQTTTDQVLAEVAAANGIERRGLVLKLITALKQVCNHPAQFLRETGPMRRRSGKLDAVDELLEVIVEQREHALLFTQYVTMGTLIEKHLAERGLRTRFLHGSVPVGRRQQMVDDFQAGEADVFILSLKAGGTGLNLTTATHVIHYDRWWNPAVEDQASDRAWRIGQEKPVQIHRMVCEGTLEDRIAAVIAGKRNLAESIVGGSETWISELSNDELAELVSLSAPTP